MCRRSVVFPAPDPPMITVVSLRLATSRSLEDLVLAVALVDVAEHHDVLGGRLSRALHHP